ncbi:MAG: hypothetical protein ABI673_05915 [Novosphingobium sp.]
MKFLRAYKHEWAAQTMISINSAACVGHAMRIAAYWRAAGLERA